MICHALDVISECIQTNVSTTVARAILAASRKNKISSDSPIEDENLLKQIIVVISMNSVLDLQFDLAKYNIRSTATLAVYDPIVSCNSGKEAGLIRIESN